MFEKKEKKEKRFVIKSEHNLGLGGVQIIVDNETGVNYINVLGGSMNGLTPLLDSKGNVVIDPVKK